MAVLLHDCPHCPARNSTFTIVWQSPRFSETLVGPFWRWATAQCGACLKYILCDFLFSKNPQITSDELVSSTGNVDKLFYYLVRSFPSRTVSAAPAHVPETVSAAYLDGVETFAIGRWNPAGGSFRRALDIATRHLIDDEAKKKAKLFDRIEYLAKQGKITSSLQDWAHVIRDDGNDAAHDDEPFTEGKAERLWRFTEMFLTYVYTMPGELAARRIELDPKI